MASSREIRFLFPLFAVLINGSYTVQSIVVVAWLNFVRTLRVIKIITHCFLGDMFFNYKDFAAGLAVKCAINFVEHLIYHLITSGIGKLLWGYNEYSWFHGQFYLLQAVWLVFWNTKQQYDIYQYRLPRRRCTEIPEGTPAYTYTPLDPGSIRLLLLHPRHPDHQIRCSLIATPLDKPPKFEAMSYTWGNTQRDGRFQVLLDNKAINVTANAFSLLRDRSSYFFPRLLWIDSICIDQNDVSERTQQVRLMDRIYRSASLVTVWLSATEAERSVLDEYLDNMHAILALDLVDKIRILDPIFSNKFTVYKQLMASRTAKTGSLQWEQLMRMLDNDWFKRIWVVQEVVLGSSVRVLYDRAEMDWRTFAEGLSVLASRAPSLVEWTDDIRVRTRSRAFKLVNILNIQEWKESQAQGKSIAFADVAMATRGCHATDARDKVFGIQGFSAEAKHPWPLPDYSKPLSTIYIEAALRIASEGGISRTMSADGVGYFDHPTAELEELPSWVPDFSRALPCGNLSHYSPKLDYHAGGPPGLDAYSLVGSNLVISAHVMDSIGELAPPHNVIASATGHWDLGQVRGILSALDVSRSLIFNSPKTRSLYCHTPHPQNLEEAFCRLLIGNRTFQERPPLLSLVLDYRGFVESLQTLARLLDQNQFPDRVMTKEEWEVHEKGHAYGNLIMRGWAGRRVCITQRGYIGLVPPLARKGDAVAIVRRAQTPFVLRLAGTGWHYRLVGECYVHGLMDGEGSSDDRWRDVRIV